MESLNACIEHKNNISCLCMNFNCKTRKLCEKCLPRHPSSHRSCFVYLDEIYDGMIIDEIFELENKQNTNLKYLDEKFINLEKFFHKKLEEARKELQERIKKAYCMHDINSKSVEAYIEKFKREGFNDSDLDKFSQVIRPHIEFRKKSDQESMSILAVSISPSVNPIIQKGTDMHFESIIETIFPKEFNSVIMPEQTLKKFKSIELSLQYPNAQINNPIEINVNIDQSNIPQLPISGQELELRKQAYVVSSVDLQVEDGVYFGETYNGIPEGKGKKVFNDGSSYEGEFFEGKAYGYGILIHADGDRYEGGFFRGVAQGYGIYTHGNGNQYKGMWENDKQHGSGREVWSDGSSYEGEYQYGVKSGQGKFGWADGSVYSGGFINNKIDGYGEYKWADGRVYKGQWKENKMHGYGEFIWQDGRKYIGNYVNDKKCGFGSFLWPDGRKYIGNWSDGKQHGEGEFINASGVVKKGVWESGKRIRWLE